MKKLLSILYLMFLVCSQPLPAIEQELEISYVTASNVSLSNNEIFNNTQLEFRTYQASLFFGDYKDQITNLPSWTKVKDSLENWVISVDLTDDNRITHRFKTEVNPYAIYLNVVITSEIFFTATQQSMPFLFRHILIKIPEQPFSKIKLVHNAMLM